MRLVKKFERQSWQSYETYRKKKVFLNIFSKKITNAVLGDTHPLNLYDMVLGHLSDHDVYISFFAYMIYACSKKGIIGPNLYPLLW